MRQISFDDIYGEGTVKKGDQFDVICSCEALYHSSDRSTVLDNVKELLSPGGIVYISDILKNADSRAEDQAVI